MQGLTYKEVNEKIQEGKLNKKIETNSRSYLDIIISNIFTYFNAVNFILFLLVLSVHSYKNLLFFIVVLSNSAVRIIQEIRAKKILDKLEIMIENKVDVIREGKKETISIYDLVVDDLFVCKEGMQVPTDSIMLSGQIETNESLLTGEITPQLKLMDDQIYSGTFVVSGEAICKVVTVGKDNRSEQIIAAGKEIKGHEIELKKSLNKIIRSIGFFLIPIGSVLFYYQRSILEVQHRDAIIQTTSAMIGMIPSGLIFLTSVALVVSVIRLGKRKILVQELHSIETLSRATVICLDKTGTLTEGKHRVHHVKTNLEKFDKVMGSYCRIFPGGNATSQALREYFEENLLFKEERHLAFSSSRKYSAIEFKEEGTYYLGAYQALFPNGDSQTEDQVKEELAKGYRLLVLGHSGEKLQENGLPQDLKSVACIFIQDQVRRNVAEIIGYFKTQQIQCKVFSGDDPITVSRVAQEATIENGETWIDASKSSVEELREALSTTAVFGRMMPEQKRDLVETLQNQGHIVAMVGDGINDIPALKKADLSVALGNGSDATKNVSNMVLLNSDFNAFPQVVQEGRRVINNLCNATSMFLIKTIFSILLVGMTMLLGVEYPFSPIQLTIVGAFSVGIPTFLLQFEASEKRVEGNFLKMALKRSLPCALLIVGGILAISFLQKWQGFSNDVATTAITIQTAILYTMALYFVYSPLTKIRTIVIVLMQVMMVATLFVLSSFLELYPLTPILALTILIITGLSVIILHQLYKKQTVI